MFVSNVTFTTKWDVCVYGGEMVLANLNASLYQIEINPTITSYLPQKNIVMPNYPEFQASNSQMMMFVYPQNLQYKKYAERESWCFKTNSKLQVSQGIHILLRNTSDLKSRLVKLNIDWSKKVVDTVVLHNFTNSPFTSSCLGSKGLYLFTDTYQQNNYSYI